MVRSWGLWGKNGNPGALADVMMITISALRSRSGHEGRAILLIETSEPSWFAAMCGCMAGRGQLRICDYLDTSDDSVATSARGTLLAIC
jgi:hypothetical protein